MQIVKLWCDKTPYQLPEGEHTGSNLNAFFGVPDDYNLYLESIDPNKEDDYIPRDDAAVMLSGARRFYTIPIIKAIKDRKP